VFVCRKESLLMFFKRSFHKVKTNNMELEHYRFIQDGTAQDPHLVIAFDIECTGAQAPFQHAIAAVGFCVALVDKKKKSPHIVEKKRFTFKVHPHQFEERCMTQFWNTLPDKVRGDLLEGKDPLHPPTDTIHNVYAFLKYYTDFYNKKIRDRDSMKLVWLTDNPAYDAGILNAALASHGYQPLHLIADRYVGITDSGSIKRVISQRIDLPGETGSSDHTWEVYRDLYFRIGKETEHVPHDHYPENDAHHHLVVWFESIKCYSEYTET